MKILISLVLSFVMAFAIVPARYAGLKNTIKESETFPIDSKRWAFIIAVEEYENTDEVIYSQNSGEMFEFLAHKQLGVSQRNTYSLINEKATTARIIDKLEQLVENVKEGDTIFFYYSGHGVPVPAENNEPYILPIDKSINNLSKTKALKLSNIYKKLASSKATKVIAFVDSCFSGATDKISIFKGVAAPRLIAKNVQVDKSKMVVITAGSDKQFSNMYKKEKQRLFSYFLMNGIAEKGYRDLDKLFDYVKQNVSTTSSDFGELYKQIPTKRGISNIEF